MLDNNNLIDFQFVVDGLERSIQTAGITVVGVCGFAGAGKTTLCQTLAKQFPERYLRLDCDRFSALSYTDRIKRIERAKTSSNRTLMMAEENPINWYDWGGIIKAIQSLRGQGKFATNRAWNRNSGQLDDRYELSLQNGDQVVVLLRRNFLVT